MTRYNPRTWMLWAGLVVIAALSGLRYAPATADAQQTDLPDVATYELWLREALVAAQRSDRLGLEQAAERLISVEHVQTSTGARVPVDNSWLHAALDDPDPDFEQIEARLGAVLVAVAGPDAAVADGAREQLDTILSNPPFSAAEDVGENLITRFLDWIFDVLEDLFAPVAEVGSASSSLIGWIIVALCVLLLVGVFIYLLLKVRRAVTSEAHTPDQPLDPEASLTANRALQQASTLARGGDYRTAVRYLYLSSLLWLDERGVLRYDRALTNYEYLASLSSQPELRARLVPIVDTFDRVWYGHAVLDEASFQTYRQQVEELRRTVRS